MASREGHTQTVKVLLSHGALVDYQDKVRTGTAMYMDMYMPYNSLPHHDIMVLSLKNGQTPLHFASVGGHIDTVTVLLERKTKVDLQNEVSGENDTSSHK